MKNVDLLNSETLDLPVYRGDIDFLIHLDKLYSDYLKLIKLSEGNIAKLITSKLSLIEMEIDLIKESVKLYFQGKTSESYSKISECLTLLNQNSFLEVGYIEGDFYRIRNANNNNLSRKDIFHVPFQIREKVATQRYSIPGLPCLYIADSIYTAWEEMNRPNFNDIHISRFNFEDRNFNLLFLNTSTREIRERYISEDKIINENIVVKFLSFWPLLAACSYNVSKKQDVFKPEYIIPQMVLQWIIETPDIDGVQFKSNRLLSNSKNVGSFNNVAIPVQSNKQNGFCDILTGKIRFTEPLSWSLLDISSADLMSSKTLEDLSVGSIQKASYIELINGEKTDYFKTKFGVMENKLKEMKLDVLN